MVFPISLIDAYPITHDPDQLYRRVVGALVPILISLTRNADSCFSQNIYLCDRSNQVRICPGYPEIKNHCPNKYRFVIFLITIRFEKPDGSSNGIHSEAILIDHLCQVIEFYEPNGASATWHNRIATYLKHEFQYLMDYHFRSTTDFCPLVGPQRIARAPICAVFTLLFFWMRVENPSLTSDEIIDLLIHQPNLKLFMDKLISYLYHYAIKHRIFRLQLYYDALRPNYDVDEAYLNLDLPLLAAIKRMSEENLS